MTCIVGIVDNGKVIIGGDSAGVSGYLTTLRADAKVFRNGSFLIGFTSSFRMGQLLRYTFHPPERPTDMDIFEYMVKMFVESVRECLKNGGYTRKEYEQESGGVFLIGYEGRLFIIDSDFQVSESITEYAAVGSGNEIALGVLYATNKETPRSRIEMALKAAEYFISGVRSPFTIDEIG